MILTSTLTTIVLSLLVGPQVATDDEAAVIEALQALGQGSVGADLARAIIN